MRTISIAVGMAWGTTLSAQDRHEPAAAMIARANVFYSLARPPPTCTPADRGWEDIVVCSRRDSNQRVVGEGPERRPENKLAAVGRGSAGGGMPLCFLQKCPKKLYFIDLAKIPEAPSGSDADRIGNGEMRPR